MSAFATITLAPHGLELRCPAANLREDRPLDDQSVELLKSWGTRYQQAAAAKEQNALLLQLGQEMHDWLNGADSFLTRLQDAAQPPLLMEFAVGKKDDSPLARAFLDAPWEVLASEHTHWALRGDMAFCPIRRLGKAIEPPVPSPHRLSLVFMAAAPRGADNLNYEAEEASILNATKDVPLHLAVEESGTLELLNVQFLDGALDDGGSGAFMGSSQGMRSKKYSCGVPALKGLVNMNAPSGSN